MKKVSEVQLNFVIFIGLIVLSTVLGYPQKPDDNTSPKPDDKPSTPSPNTSVATKEPALSTTIVVSSAIAVQPATVAVAQPTTIPALPTVSTVGTTIAIKALENVEPSSSQRQKRQATIPAFPTNALPGNGVPSNLGPPPNGAPPTGSIPLPASGSSLPQPNIATVGSASPQVIASAAPIAVAGAAAASLQPVKFPQAGK
ncbi:mucin-7-like isoform X1 [Chironomus tepperi]|uniref:mucin-7-like isoform X1 n=1 Tax=Chironomus tepperi TaxID=113505 RepID=UPI00391F93F3